MFLYQDWAHTPTVSVYWEWNIFMLLVGVADSTHKLWRLVLPQCVKSHHWRILGNAPHTFVCFSWVVVGTRCRFESLVWHSYRQSVLVVIICLTLPICHWRSFRFLSNHFKLQPTKIQIHRACLWYWVLQTCWKYWITPESWATHASSWSPPFCGHSLPPIFSDTFIL